MLITACGGESAHEGGDVVGPFTGPTYRYVVDGFAVPRDPAVARGLGGDLDGDGEPENQLGVITSLLASGDDLSVDAADMIASGALASTVEITADDLVD